MSLFSSSDNNQPEKPRERHEIISNEEWDARMQQYNARTKDPFIKEFAPKLESDIAETKDKIERNNKTIAEWRGKQLERKSNCRTIRYCVT